MNTRPDEVRESDGYSRPLPDPLLPTSRESYTIRMLVGQPQSITGITLH